MAEAFDTRELAATLDDVEFPVDDDRPKTMNDLPNDVLVSVFVAVGDQRLVRHTFPLVCRAWPELYRSKDASPLHETLEVNFRKEAEGAAAREGEEEEEEEEEEERARRRPVVHASRVISWAERRAGSVRKLHFEGGFRGALNDFSSLDLGTIVAVAAPSLTGIRIRVGPYAQKKKPFWESLRGSVVRAGRLRSLAVKGVFTDVSESDVDSLGQLAGSLEELVLDPHFDRPGGFEGVDFRLRRFPESLCALTELRRLALVGHF